MSNQLKAVNAVALAKRRGDLPHLTDGKTACVDCGNPASVYDHRDYLKPLEVDPVCRVCNSKRGPAMNHNGPHELVKQPGTVDFQELIIKLIERGWTQPRIAKKFGYSTAMISKLKTGKIIEPKYHFGVGLIDLERRTRGSKS